MRILILILTFFISSNGLSQDNINPKELIGFGCYAGGTSSDVVNDTTFDIHDGKYKKVIKKLKSKNPAERFMAVIVAERLSELDKYDLTETDKELIKKAYESTDLVSVCSGCTYFDQIELKKLLLKDEENFMWTYAKYWLEEYLEK
ncbi:hypothetical protein FK220_019850 [Flavobacteriaceae bacterium TP-CH-4]|uniref:Uncharacterized protein n=1 Tax=Pelagihabitans pacificus TaxID=2696054 RepID=A0A967AXB2_9FLAO|nr:hypothetical protein [Pelagihabitans pacificus]NHF61614.1 hypothetical protein [Pelagihabitans pacificus]